MDNEAIEEVAARWFAKRESGTWTEHDQAEFDTWLQVSTAHRVQFLRVETAWKHAARLKALGAGVPPGTIPPRGSWGDIRFSAAKHGIPIGNDGPQSRGLRCHRASPRFVRQAAVAAALVVAVSGGYFYTVGIAAGDRYSTPIGGLDTVALKDGSHITLNTDSQLRVDIRDRERRIALAKGEAFFEVAHDPRRPFVVEAGDRRVIAVGTKFSVRYIPAQAGIQSEENDIQVVVTEGKVRIEPTSGNNDLEPSARAVLLTAGSVARTSRDEVLVRPQAALDTEKLLSWRGGYVNFDDMALADAVAEFNRYTTRKIFIEDPSIAAIRVSGNFRSNNADAFLWLLQSGFPIKVERTDDRIILKSR